MSTKVSRSVSSATNTANLKKSKYDKIRAAFGLKTSKKFKIGEDYVPLWQLKNRIRSDEPNSAKLHSPHKQIHEETRWVINWLLIKANAKTLVYEYFDTNVNLEAREYLS